MSSSCSRRGARFVNLVCSGHVDEINFWQVWSSYSVLNVLYSLIQKSKVNDYILASQEGKSPEEIAYVH
jgi:hypothetical protein